MLLVKKVYYFFKVNERDHSLLDINMAQSFYDALKKTLLKQLNFISQRNEKFEVNANGE